MRTKVHVVEDYQEAATKRDPSNPDYEIEEGGKADCHPQGGGEDEQGDCGRSWGNGRDHQETKSKDQQRRGTKYPFKGTKVPLVEGYQEAADEARPRQPRLRD